MSEPQDKISCAILTVSDGCFRGEREDKSGAALAERAAALGWEVVERKLVPDERVEISDALKEWLQQGWGAKRRLPDLVLTTGGTGLGPRDVTPEATLGLAEDFPLEFRAVPGLAECMRAAGAAKTPKAWLSRGMTVAVDKTLIVNLPGSPKGALESLAAIEELIPHAIHILGGGGH